MSYSRILGTGSYLPEKILTNAELETLVETSDEWITTRTGIKQRHILGDHETSGTMATAAARAAIDMAGIEVNDIELIIVGTCTPDMILPSTACLVQQHLGIDNNCIAFDLNAACAGFIYGLSVADQYIKAGAIKHALVIGSESMSRLLNWSDRSTCVLFGDGAGAVVLGQSTEPGIYSTHIHADGHHSKLLYSGNNLRDHVRQPDVVMEGNEVFKVAVTKLKELVGETLAANNLQESDVDWLIPHQANMRIINAVAKRLSMPAEKVVVTVAEHGNTSAASVPLAMDTAVRAGHVKRGHTCLLEAFGGGLAWGSALVKF